MKQWIRTIDDYGTVYNFNVDNTWMIRSESNKEIRFRPSSRESYIDVGYKNEQTRDAELKRIESILYKDVISVG